MINKQNKSLESGLEECLANCSNKSLHPKTSLSLCCNAADARKGITVSLSQRRTPTVISITLHAVYKVVTHQAGTHQHKASSIACLLALCTQNGSTPRQSSAAFISQSAHSVRHVPAPSPMSLTPGEQHSWPCPKVLDVYGSQPCWHPDATLYLWLGLQLSKGEFQFQVPKRLLKLITTFWKDKLLKEMQETANTTEFSKKQISQSAHALETVRCSQLNPFWTRLAFFCNILQSSLQTSSRLKEIKFMRFWNGAETDHCCFLFYALSFFPTTHQWGWQDCVQCAPCPRDVSMCCSEVPEDWSWQTEETNMDLKLCESWSCSSVIFFNRHSARGLAQIQSPHIVANSTLLLFFLLFLKTTFLLAVRDKASHKQPWK